GAVLGPLDAGGYFALLVALAAFTSRSHAPRGNQETRRTTMSPETLTLLDLPASPAVRWGPANVIWDLTTLPGAERVYHRLSEMEPALPSVLRRLHHEVPIARTCASFAAEPYSRPFEHRRCFYFSLDSGGTLSFKGTEPLAEDFAEEVQH